MTAVTSSISKIEFTYQHFESGDAVSSVRSRGINARTDLPDTLIDYEYNSVGEKVLANTPVGSFTYERDTAGRLRSLINPEGKIFEFKYDANQRLKEISSPAVVTTFEFDTIGFNSQISHSRRSGANIERFSYGRDLAGIRLSKTTNQGTSTFTYDKNYQLIEAITPNLPVENFTYDSVGNRLSDSSSDYLFDASKQEIKEDNKFLYVFDLNGNLISKQEKGFSGNVQNYAYSSENQLKSFQLFINGVLAKEVAYTYDAIGRRIEKAVIDHVDSGKSFIRRFMYDSKEILAEFDHTNQVLSSYTHSTLRTDDALSVTNSQGTFYFVKDALGSVTDITDSNGIKVQHHEYSSFGKLEKVTDASGSDIHNNPVIEPFITFTGREYDKETGLYYYRARYYDPLIGRFLSSDPSPGQLNYPQTYNTKYAYAGNNPIMHIDPSGEAFLGISNKTWEDIAYAAAAIAIIYFSGGTAMGAFEAVGSTAIGSGMAAGAMSYGQTGSFTQNFSSNFHTIFRTSVTFLAASALVGGAQAGTLGTPNSSGFQAGGTGITGYAGPKVHPNPLLLNGGLNLSGTSAYMGGEADLALRSHESLHTVQFIGYSFLAGYAEKQNGTNGSTWTLLYGGYILTNAPGAITGAY